MFFKVFYDRLQTAQMVIKASMSATTDASLAQSMDTHSKEKLEEKCKGLALSDVRDLFIVLPCLLT